MLVNEIHRLLRRCTYKANHLDATLLEFIFQLREGTELGCAHWSEICRMAEEDGPPGDYTTSATCMHDIVPLDHAVSSASS